MVKGGIEARELRHRRIPVRWTASMSDKGLRHVGRIDGCEPMEIGQQRVGDHLRRCMSRAAVDDAMSNRVDGKGE